MDAPDWEDLRLLLAVSRGGSLRAAARETGLNHATLSRRMARLSERIGSPVLEADGRGLSASEAGEALLHAAERMGDAFDAGVERARRRPRAMAGQVRISMPAVVLPLVSTALAELSQAHPELHVSVDTGVRVVDMRRRQADLVLRVAADPDPDLVGRKLGEWEMGLFGAPRWAEAAEHDDVAELPWVDWTPETGRHPAAQWVRESTSPQRVVARASTAAAMLELIAAGVGIGYLWAPAARSSLRPLVQISESPAHRVGLWVLTRPELRRTVRVRTVSKAMVSALAPVMV